MLAVMYKCSDLLESLKRSALQALSCSLVHLRFTQHTTAGVLLTLHSLPDTYGALTVSGVVVVGCFERPDYGALIVDRGR